MSREKKLHRFFQAYTIAAGLLFIIGTCYCEFAPDKIHFQIFYLAAGIFSALIAFFIRVFSWKVEHDKYISDEISKRYAKISEENFKLLVSGKIADTGTVKLILSDIGFSKISKIISEAETEFYMNMNKSENNETN